MNKMTNFFKNLNRPNSPRTTKVIRSIQACMLTLSGTTYVMHKPELAFYLLAAAGAADVILSALDNGDGKNT